MSFPSPLTLEQDLRETFIRYIDTAFALRDERLQDERRQLLLSGQSRLFTPMLLEPIVPYDGTDAYGSLISMDEIRNWSGVMSAAKHQMFVLDACFGGLIATRGSTVDPRTPDYVEAVTKRRSRQILTAGGANQKVADGGPNGHSLFTGQLLKALSDENNPLMLPVYASLAFHAFV